MKAIYGWVPWFRELAAKIKSGGPAFLIRKAREVEWPGKKLLVNGADEWIDPFSFLYTLAQKATPKQRPRVFPSVDEVFGIQKKLPDPTRGDLYIFPIPPAIANACFHDGTPEHFVPLWDLFRQATTDADPISAELFEQVLEIKGVAPPKLSHGLFLANPHRFLPIDGFSVLETTPCATDLPSQPTCEEFDKAAEQAKRCFPGCEPFEINYFLYYQGAEGLLSNDSSIFQISTNVKNDKNDEWKLFEKENAVWTGGSRSKKKKYPIESPKRGDIILVRFGQKHGTAQGKAIGVVLDNDYARHRGWSPDRRIHVLWINRTEADLPQDTVQIALSGAGTKTLQAFKNTEQYQSSFRLIEQYMTIRAPDPVVEQEVKQIEPRELSDDSPQMHSLNQILYGPPGTGKTWNTVNRAVAIVEGRTMTDVEREAGTSVGRDAVKARFDVLRDGGQIAMVTFHQNYAYEDFIEGIRPVVAEESDGGVAYERRHGVFRVLADRATANLLGSRRRGAKSWDVEEVVQGFFEWVEEETMGGATMPLESEGKNQKEEAGLAISGVYRGADGEVAGVTITGRAEQKLFRDVLARDYRKFRDRKITSYRHIKPTKPSKSLWHGQAIYFLEVLKKMKEYHDEHRDTLEGERVERKNFVLIIDEINRGNIARIFGELITLVEESRRIGRKDETIVTLPYSEQKFGVPENLYLVGTMNTADRSIALLDTALRRRFEFVEMVPKDDHEGVPKDVEGVDCQQLLRRMNRRIRFLRDREHQIGHTYFLGVENIGELRKAFQNRIVPLLQEYFYDDWAKIDAVLAGNGFVKAVKCPEELKGKDLVDDDRDAYDVLPFSEPEWGKAAAYRKIYAGRVEKGAAPTDGEQPKGRAEAQDG